MPATTVCPVAWIQIGSQADATARALKIEAGSGVTLTTTTSAGVARSAARPSAATTRTPEGPDTPPMLAMKVSALASTTATLLFCFTATKSRRVAPAL